MTERETIKQAQKLLSGAMDELTVRISKAEQTRFEIEYFGPIREWMRQAKRSEPDTISREPDYETAKLLDYCRRMIGEEKEYWLGELQGDNRDEAEAHLDRINSMLDEIGGQP